LKDQNNSNSKVQAIAHIETWGPKMTAMPKFKGTKMYCSLKNIVTNGFQHFQYHNARHTQHRSKLFKKPEWQHSPSWCFLMGPPVACIED